MCEEATYHVAGLKRIFTKVNTWNLNTFRVKMKMRERDNTACVIEQLKIFLPLSFVKGTNTVGFMKS